MNRCWIKFLAFPKTTLTLALLLLLVTLAALSRLGSEFMPPLDEGDLLYMPSTLPGISARAKPVVCCNKRIG